MLKVTKIVAQSIRQHVRTSTHLQSQQSTRLSSSRLFSSEATANDESQQDQEVSSSSLYFWGTSNKGTIPTKEVLEVGRIENEKQVEASGVASNLDILKSNSTVIDTPTEIDIQDAFGIEKDAIRDIECGPNSTAVILSNNTALLFGKNDNGQLGHGHRKNVLVPTLLNPPDSTPLHHDQISKIKLGTNFTAIIDTNGDLYTCGYNGSTLAEGIGCLGHGYFPEEYLNTPKLVDSLVEDGCSVDQVAVGNYHMVVLTTEGEVLTSGSAQWGRVGNLDTGDQLFLEPVEMLVSETDVCQIEAGESFSLALTKNDGIIFSWGENKKGQCGTGSGLSVEMYAMEPMPVPIEGMLEGRKVVKMSAGKSHAAALTENGEVFVWGMDIVHQPELVTDLAHANIVDVQCGHGYTMALDDEGKIYTLGKSKAGVLGIEKQTKTVTPTLIDAFLDKKVTKMFAGWNHAACLT